MTSKPIILGAHGMVGTRLCEQFGEEAHGISRQELDLEKLETILPTLHQLAPSAIINAAAYTKVDLAEDEPEKANTINHLAVAKLAAYAFEASIPFIHISTDYVFDGEKKTPYLETDTTNPQNQYGLSKWKGEQAILQLAASYPQSCYLICRTAWVWDTIGSNFYRTILRLAAEKPELRIVSDQIGCPTNASDLATLIKKLWARSWQASESGIYHTVGNEIMSWYDFAQKILAANQLTTPLIPITTADFPTKAKRPAYSVLSTRKVERLLQSISIPT
jgi:dTDP-4-dehydrorhamnose reductase